MWGAAVWQAGSRATQCEAPRSELGREGLKCCRRCGGNAHVNFCYRCIVIMCRHQQASGNQIKINSRYTHSITMALRHRCCLQALILIRLREVGLLCAGLTTAGAEVSGCTHGHQAKPSSHSTTASATRIQEESPIAIAATAPALLLSSACRAVNRPGAANHARPVVRQRAPLPCFRACGAVHCAAQSLPASLPTHASWNLAPAVHYVAPLSNS